MKKQSKNKNVYQKKRLFNSILYGDLKSCKYTIIAHFEWKKNAQVFSVCPSYNNILNLGINLNFNALPVFENSSSEEAIELSLKYRAYYISSYIRCLETVGGLIPGTYFSGIVLLCAVNDLCEKNKKIYYSPIDKEKPKELNPLSIHCSIHALNRVSLEYADTFVGSIKNNFGTLINNLLTYSLLPEIGYIKYRPVYSLLLETRKLTDNIILKRCSPEKYALFFETGLTDFINKSLNELVLLSVSSQNPFWLGAVVRFYAHTNQKWMQNPNENTSSISYAVQKFYNETVLYCEEKKNNLILNDNFVAIERLTRKIDKTFESVTVNSGKLHYYQ